LNRTKDKNKSFFKQIDDFCINVLPFIIVYELVLGGSGRVIMLSSQITIRYFLFFIAMLYYFIVIFNDIFKYKLSLKALIKKRLNRNLVFLIIFLFLFLYAIFNGYRNGNTISDIFTSSKGFFYILMLFPFSLFVDSKEKAKKLVKAFINYTVILAIITFVIFIIYGLNNETYNIFGVVLNKWSYEIGRAHV